MLPIKAALLSILLAPSFALGAPAEDRDIVFASLPYPVQLQVPAGAKSAVRMETEFSAAPGADYDTVLIQGLMPDADLRLELVVKARFFLSSDQRYSPETFRRFPNGRFWARYRLPALTSQPLRFSVVAQGSEKASAITIYGTELLKFSSMREEPQGAQAYVYVPDPSMSVPDTIPFKLVRRAQWGAAAPKEAYTRHTPRYFTIHHTQWHYPATYDDAVTEMKLVQDFHQNGRGWIDIAYHFLIDPAGNIFEGRPIYAVGAHVKNRNTGNIGISIMGDYHPPTNNPFTKATEDSFVAVGTYLKDTYSVNVSSFYAHRDIGQTDCPGDIIYARKEYLRGLIFDPKPAPQADAQLPLPAAQQRALDRLLRELPSIEAKPQ